MNHYANDEQRVRLIAGLRDLAVFLEQNPDVPAPSRADLLIFPPEASDAEMFAEIVSIQALRSVLRAYGSAETSDGPGRSLVVTSVPTAVQFPRRRRPRT